MMIHAYLYSFKNNIRKTKIVIFIVTFWENDSLTVNIEEIFGVSSFVYLICNDTMYLILLKNNWLFEN